MLGMERSKKGSGVVIDLTPGAENVKVAVGIDAGSTETRVVLADTHDVEVFLEGMGDDRILDILTSTYKIPSSYANVDDAKEIAPVSTNLEDNYDSNIILVNNGAEKPFIGRHRVIRGRKVSDAMGTVLRYLDSSTNKSDNIIFYTNIIDSIGYAILQKYNGRIPKEVSVILSLSVRPKELNSLCRNRMTENLVGTYMFIWKGTTINININKVLFTTEPQAQIEGTTLIYDARAAIGIDSEYHKRMANTLADSSCYIHIEGGGSSIGVEVIKDGSIIDAASQTFPLGGNYLAQMFIDRYREQTGKMVTKEAANKAIVDCLLRDGRNQIDVNELVADCKNRVGMDILERVRHEVIDIMSDLVMTDVEFITLGGRLFAEDVAGNTIGYYFEQYLQQISANTEVITLKENFIPQGNLMKSVDSEYFAEFISKEETTVEEEKYPTKDAFVNGSEDSTSTSDEV